MKKKLTTLLLVVWLCPYTVVAQSKQLQQADKLLQGGKYAEAIPLLETAADKAKRGPMYEQALQQLGIAYQKTGKFAEAFRTLKTLHDANPQNINVEALLAYAQVAASTEQYELSQRLYSQYGQRNPSDSRPRRFIPAYMDKTMFSKTAADFTLRPLPAIGGLTATFSPTFYKDGIAFVGSKKATTALEKGSGGDLLNLYYIPKWQQLRTPSASIQPLDFPSNFDAKLHLGPITFVDGKQQHVIVTKNAFERKKIKEGMHVNTLVMLESKLQNGQWSNLTELPFTSKDYSCGHPAMSADGKQLYFVSDMPGGFGGTDLYVVSYNNGRWGTPINLGKEVNTEGNEMFPFIDTAGNLYFSSDGHAGLGGLDIFQVPIREGKVVEAEIKNLEKPFNSSRDDFGIATDSSRNEGFISSTRSGIDHLYYFSRNVLPKVPEKPSVAAVTPTVTNPVVPNQTTPKQTPPAVTTNAPSTANYGIAGVVTSLATSRPLAGANVTLFDICNNRSVRTTTNAIGQYQFTTESAGPYLVKVEHRGYADSEEYAGKLMLGSTLQFPISLMQQGDILTINNIYYDYGSDALTETAQIELRLKVIPLFKKFPSILLEVGSHTDSRSSSEFNMELSQRRAERVVEFLIANGVNPRQVIGRGYGETQLKNECADGVSCSEVRHFENRRTEFKVLSASNGVSVP